MDMKYDVYSPPTYDQHILEPVQVHAFFRHGARSPVPFRNVILDHDLWASRVQARPPQLPHKMEYEHQEFPWGQLSRKVEETRFYLLQCKVWEWRAGKEQALELGEWLRRIYWDVMKFSEENLPSRISFRSTNFERTHLTGWYVLSGLLGSSEAAQSIPVDIRGEKNDTLADTGQYRRLRAVAKEYMEAAMQPVQQPDGTFKQSETSLLYEEVKAGIAGFLGLAPDTAFNWLVMIPTIDVLECGVMHGDPLPESVSTADLYAVKAALGNQLMTVFQDKTYMRLGMGRLLREIAEAISQHPANSSQTVPSLHLYSGHDVTIMALSAALGAPVKEWPGYCANIIIELLKSADLSGQYFVRVLYNGAEVPVTLFNSSKHEIKNILTLDEFFEQAAQNIISEEEFQMACQPTEGVNVNIYEDTLGQPSA